MKPLHFLLLLFGCCLFNTVVAVAQSTDWFTVASKENHFYFVDKNGEEIGKLGRWNNAKQFNLYTGFAEVELIDHDNNITKYLLDTLGNSYRIAHNVKDLNPDVTALDLSDKN